MEFAQSCGFTPHEVADVALAVGEACNNATEHGHVAGGSFTLSGHCSSDALTLDVHDAGQGFELRGKGLGIDPDKRGVRGLGIFIMRAIMDDVSYRMDDTGTRVTLVKQRRPARHAASAEQAGDDETYDDIPRPSACWPSQTDDRRKPALEVVGQHPRRARKG